MTTIHLNQSDEKWRDKDDEISLGFWDRFCDLFCPEKKADVLAAVWDFMYTADAVDNDPILLPENKIRAFLRLKELSDKPESFITELNMTEKGQAGCTLWINFRIKNEPVGNTEHSFTNSDKLKTKTGNNQLINNNDNNNKLIQQILESAVRNGIDLHNISLENVKLAGPRLEHARLRNARLAHISLVQAVLYQADLRYADLGGVNNLHGPQLTFTYRKLKNQSIPLSRACT